MRLKDIYLLEKGNLRTTMNYKIKIAILIRSGWWKIGREQKSLYD